MKSMYRHAPRIDRSQSAVAKKRSSGKRRKASETAAKPSPKRNRKKAKNSDKERVETRRSVAWSTLGRVLLGAALLLGIPTGGYYGWDALLEVEALRVNQVTIDGRDRADHETLVAYSGVRDGQSILAVDLDEIAQSLERHPWVATASVARVFPDRIRVVIREHVPSALVSLEGLYLVNESGVVFKRWSAGDESDLPLITGLSRDVATQEPTAFAELAQTGIELSRDLTEWNETLGPIEEIHYDEALGWSAMVRPPMSTPDVVHLALGLDPHRRIALAAQSLVELDRRSLSPAAIWADGEKRPQRVHIRLWGESQSLVTAQRESEVPQ